MKYLILFFALALYITNSSGQSNNPIQPDNAKPFVLGVIEELQSFVLAEKRITTIY